MTDAMRAKLEFSDEELAEFLRANGIPQTAAAPIKAANQEVNVFVIRFLENMNRVHGLIAIHEAVAASASQAPNLQLIPNSVDDVLRSAVVLLHATVEDTLRAVAAFLLPHTNADVLKEIPLADPDNKKRLDKFTLGDLSKHKGKTVDDVIHDSVMHHLERSSFSTIDEIVGLLKKLEIDYRRAEPVFPDLENMMQRRHQIVHRADKKDVPGTGERVFSPISAEEVVHWTDAAHSLIVTVSSYLFRRNLERITYPIYNEGNQTTEPAAD